MVDKSEGRYLERKFEIRGRRSRNKDFELKERSLDTLIGGDLNVEVRENQISVLIDSTSVP